MVRGPMVAAVTAGWLIANAMAIAFDDKPGSSGPGNPPLAGPTDPTRS